MFLFCLVFAVSLCASVHVCFVVACWEGAGLLALVCGALLWICRFPIGVLGQVWSLIVSIPDLCTFTYFNLLRISIEFLIDQNKLLHPFINCCAVFNDIVFNLSEARSQKNRQLGSCT